MKNDISCSAEVHCTKVVSIKRTTKNHNFLTSMKGNE